jgi:hypothetical protein
MRFALVLALLVGCESRHEVASVTEAEATDFAAKYAAATMPCDEAKLAELIDGEAMAQRAHDAAKTPAGRVSGLALRDAHTTAHSLCVGGARTEQYRLLHVTTADGEPRPVMRRLLRASLKPVVVVGYDALKLGKSDGKVRVTDIYSYAQGAWISETTAWGVDAMAADGVDGAFDSAHAMKHARELAGQGKFADALAALDGIPAEARRSRLVQLLRVQYGEKVSQDAYKQALDELAKNYPDDPSLALIEIDGAFLRGDLDGALRATDMLDKSVGGDPFQDAVRSEVYLKRGKPGDVELAAARAEAAITAEPTLAKGWWARLDAAVRAKNYVLAVETMKHLEEHFHAKFDEDKLRKIPGYPELLDSPEYTSRGG